MTNRDSSLLLDGYPSCAASDGDSRPAGKGVLPEDFPDRLNRLKKATGHTWIVFAQVVGAGLKQVLRWRKGTEPCGGAMHSLYLLAFRTPGGLQILAREGFDEGFQVPLRRGPTPCPACPFAITGGPIPLL